MRVFVTGASGWVGTAVVEELKSAGHTLSGLARSDAAAQKLDAAGVAVVRGSLEDLDRLRAGAQAADAVVHLAFNHDFSRFAENGAAERTAIEALGAALAGTGKTLVVTSGVALIGPGRVVTEDDSRDPNVPFPRDPETVAAAVAKNGVRVSVVRLPPSTHGAGETHGFVPIVIGLAREYGVSAYVGDGANRWPGVHVRDAARLYRLALERGAEHAVYHAVAEEGVPFRRIAEVIGRRLRLPVVAKLVMMQPRISAGSNTSPASTRQHRVRRRSKSSDGIRRSPRSWKTSIATDTFRVDAPRSFSVACGVRSCRDSYPHNRREYSSTRA